VTHKPMTPAVTGALLLAATAVLAILTNRAENNFLPGILLNGGFLVLFLVSLALRWPAVGVFVGLLLGERVDEWRDVPFYEGSGCFECGGTGFRGRTAIHELLDLSEPIREMILNKRPASEIRRQAASEGMTFLRESALDKAKLGITTLKEINKVTFIEG